MSTHTKKHIQKKGSNTHELVVKQVNEEYAEIVCIVGSDARFKCKFLDNKECIAKLIGSMIKGPNKKRIEKGDFVLLQLDTSSSDQKYFIINKYSPDEKKQLAKMGEFKTFVSQEAVGKTIVAYEDDVTNTSNVVNEQEVDENFIDDI